MRFDDYIVKIDEDDGADVVPMSVKISQKDAHMIRKSIMEEMQAVNDYIERAEMCENDMVRKVFLGIAEEERVHFGELEMILESVDPLHGPSEEEGEEEVEQMMNPNSEEENGY